MSVFGQQLNEACDNVCTTDSRLRPDQRALEDGQFDRASSEKLRLEAKQRAKRKKGVRTTAADGCHSVDCTANSEINGLEGRGRIATITQRLIFSPAFPPLRRWTRQLDGSRKTRRTRRCHSTCTLAATGMQNVPASLPTRPPTPTSSSAADSRFLHRGQCHGGRACGGFKLQAGETISCWISGQSIHTFPCLDQLPR